MLVEIYWNCACAKHCCNNADVSTIWSYSILSSTAVLCSRCNTSRRYLHPHCCSSVWRKHNTARCAAVLQHSSQQRAPLPCSPSPGRHPPERLQIPRHGTAPGGAAPACLAPPVPHPPASAAHIYLLTSPSNKSSHPKCRPQSRLHKVFNWSGAQCQRNQSCW